ncbi:MAG TPA: YebC/PmpR family DNA-binding transcriptional regulator [Dehalococcoidia bacterium]|mgnify:CR=1 FL=1|nr:YebC/PmpR family DNA-binding transcriptional regulator [Dehalococcoidia bacterium]|tara:strand:- start:1116 stop:1862 length:747 start_codon:yes stop_codon:yes gene_type:complete
MSGHSKWSTIKRKKEAADSKRGALFTKLAKELQLAAKAGGPDSDTNFKLRLAVQRAKAANMPNDNISRAIAKATGGSDSEQLQEVSYEGYGPGGTAILVTAVTDNRNRTVAAIRHEFTRVGGNLGENGSVAWQFEPRGALSVSLGDSDEDEVVLAAIEAGAEDVETSGNSVEVQTSPGDLETVRQLLVEAGYTVEHADLSMVPTATVSLEKGPAAQALQLLDGLEELEDVQRVYSNADFDEELLAQYA